MSDADRQEARELAQLDALERIATALEELLELLKTKEPVTPRPAPPSERAL